MYRVVIDTNIFIAGIITDEGVAGRVITAWRERKFTLVISEPILFELARVCHYQKLIDYKPELPQQVEKLIELIIKRAVVTPGTTEINLIVDDPTDNKFLVAAIEGGADIIISSDKHLLQLKIFNKIQIMNPGQFLKLI